MDHKPYREKHRSYFSNVKTRLGQKLPGPLLAGHQLGDTRGARTAQLTEGRGHPITQPAPQITSGTHIPVIRNPQLRKYYLPELMPFQDDAKNKATDLKLSGEKVEYTVRPEDTLFSVASQFHTTPSQLVSHNKLKSHTLIPGQRLCIPEQKPSSPPQDIPSDPSDHSPRMPLSPSPDSDYDKLLDVEAVPMPDGQLCLLALPPECSPAKKEGPAIMAYLKLCCRYITDCKGVVSGVLLVTPHKIFFDPYKSHPLVLEHGCEEYLLSCSVDSISSASFFSDISRVHFSTASTRMKSRKKVQKPKALNLARAARAVTTVPGVKNSKLPDGHVDKSPPSHPSPATPDERLSSVLDRKLSYEDRSGRGDGPASEEKGHHSAVTEKLGRADSVWGGHADGLSGQNQEAESESLGAGVLSSAATFCCGGLEEEGRSGTGPEKRQGTEQHPSLGTAAPGPGPARQAPGRPALMFLRLRLRVPPRKKGLFPSEPGSAKAPVFKDAWFTLSQESSDELYAYLSHWRQDLCILEGEEQEEEEDGEDEEFVLVDEKEEISSSEGRVAEDWEMVSMDEGGGQSLIFDKEPEGLTDILEQTNILELLHIREISSHLPPRTVGHSWQLTYSTSGHGSSLKTLYRKLADTESPALLVIKDFHNQIFGAYVSDPLRPSEAFYGTGETFLFTFHPEFKCFSWTGENSFFIKGDLDSFAIGGGSGHFGLWVDENLYLGRSSPCSTFHNCPLSKTDDFRVMELEVWTFC
nr:PREDICTED: nuclear receptor coactivator 7-like [Lepisosteus oculatus]XP_015204162.1 PREDICTED: nuclear receptor coactivator 7-like [Lepisosteus oculatus]